MSSTVAKIILDIRDTLNDPDSDRWDDARLMRGINSAMEAINSRAKLLRAKLTFDILEGVHTYKLPDDVQTLTRATFNQEALDFKTHEEMDALSPSWEETTEDDITTVIFDRLNRGQLRLFPTPKLDIASEPLGVITDIEGIDFNSVLGVVTDLSLDNGSTIVIYYIKKPTKITVTTDIVELDSTWDKAIQHYVAGHTLRDDKDAQNRVFGNEELILYEDELSVAVVDSSKDFAKQQVYTSSYRKI